MRARRLTALENRFVVMGGTFGRENRIPVFS
jgi:hypothetical protein